MDSIFIKGLMVETIIGIYDFEKIKTQPVILDIEIQYDTSQACASDNIKYAVDYHRLAEEIHQYISDSTFELIEALAEAVAERILKFPLVQTVGLCVSKPNALKLAETVGIRIHRSN